MPCVGAPLAEGGHLAAIDLDLVLAQPALGGQRPGAVALDGARRLAIDDAGRLHRLEQFHLRPDAVLLRLDVAIEQQAGKPAAADADAVAVEDRPQDLGIEREAPPRLHAGETGDTRLAQAFFQRHVVAQFREVVVPPRDGGNAQLGLHVLLRG